jgi:phage baseplate assembly protein W
MDLDYPFAFDGTARTATTGTADHVRDMIELVLFTMPGERVNRPDFGSGVMQLVFAPNSAELAATTRFLVQGALQRWLGERIDVEAVDVAAEDATLRVTIAYTDRKTRQRTVSTFERRGAGP